MNDQVRLVNEDGEELLLTEVMSIALEKDMGDLNAGDEIIIYQDDKENYYPLKLNEDDTLEIVNDTNIIDVINDTLEVLGQNDEII